MHEIRRPDDPRPGDPGPSTTTGSEQPGGRRAALWAVPLAAIAGLATFTVVLKGLKGLKAGFGEADARSADTHSLLGASELYGAGGAGRQAAGGRTSMLFDELE